MMIYGSERWALRKQEEQLLHTTELKMLRWSQGDTGLEMKPTEEMQELHPSNRSCYRNVMRREKNHNHKCRGFQPCRLSTMTAFVILAAMLTIVAASTMATTHARPSRNVSHLRGAISRIPYVPCLLGNKGAHSINGNITPDSPSTTQEEDTIQHTSDDFCCFKQRGLHFIHLNARSIIPKMEELNILAGTTNAAIIAVTETWLDILYPITRYASQAMAYSAKTETVREGVFVFLSAITLISIGDVTLIKMTLNFWL